MLVEDIMRKDFTKIFAHESIEEVLKKFIKANIDSAPVFDGDEFVGLVSIYDIINHINTHGKSLFIWNREHEKKEYDKICDIYNTPVQKIATKPKVCLKIDDKLDNVIMKIANEPNCIPVFDGNNMVGLIRKKDIAIYLLTEIALHHSKKDAYNSDAKKIQIEQEMKLTVTSTIADKMMQIVKTMSPINSKEIANMLGVSETYVEKMAEMLEKHHLIEVDYSLLKGMILKRSEHETKE